MTDCVESQADEHVIANKWDGPKLRRPLIFSPVGRIYARGGQIGALLCEVLGRIGLRAHAVEIPSSLPKSHTGGCGHPYKGNWARRVIDGIMCASTLTA